MFFEYDCRPKLQLRLFASAFSAGYAGDTTVESGLVVRILPANALFDVSHGTAGASTQP